MRPDPLSDVVSLLKPRAYGFRGLDIAGAWSLHLPPERVIRCYALHSGACGLWLGNGEKVSLTAGDFVLLPHGDALVMGSARDAPPIDLDVFFAMPDGETAVLAGGGECSGLGGYFELSGAAAPLLVHALPPVMRLEAGTDQGSLSSSVAQLMGELRAPRPGGRLIAEHLTQTLLIQALRLHAASQQRRGEGWLAALADPQLARSFEAIHGHPGNRWTLDGLARTAGMSRSGFARRFVETCGEPAMAYLTRWRMVLAADRLARGERIGTIAAELGYGSESAFGAAFRRTMGVSPGRYSPR
ncbi:AraC family transcriptional regulator [Ameyamaea chiangmaiensis NBRC 103196]|uniref:AraC family transcriptional regulator n=1 Tax=Ameyamaea chiangmaiensis TaxID=442969 RepID=A0A850PGJ8_9PROT|nr:AraC family transcriptional regulator [Ameyamaea chiangmaiensis]MBS4075580.1 AraC family transcriptional regulator [Ameyamaea chiangmaiensis]NVN40291.1 AraC family transcriptional regulator [Ameyamaea chiangmaiensis]GBQ70884.1 AraC family transcriptional regulator [Ameyamaea chiangmaiensis NBRC 103196]